MDVAVPRRFASSELPSTIESQDIAQEQLASSTFTSTLLYSTLPLPLLFSTLVYLYSTLLYVYSALTFSLLLSTLLYSTLLEIYSALLDLYFTLSTLRYLMVFELPLYFRNLPAGLNDLLSHFSPYGTCQLVTMIFGAMPMFTFRNSEFPL